MKCPKCETTIKLPISEHTNAFPSQLPWEEGKGSDVAVGFCPECSQQIILLRFGTTTKFEEEYSDTYYLLESSETEEIIYPIPHPHIRKLPKEVPSRCRADYSEAEQVLSVSSKASAALSRRLLQSILREEHKVKRATLFKEIQEFVSRPGIPSHLTDALDHIRVIGNFASHPLKEEQTGEIIDVEAGEAEWLLDVLESLIDFTFVQPIRLDERKKQIEKKLASVSKSGSSKEATA